MTTVIEAVFENGVLKPVGAADFKEHQRYRLLVQESAPSQETFPENGNVDLIARGIDQQQAAELRAKLQTFAGDWESEEMNVYDDYHFAKSRL